MTTKEITVENVGPIKQLTVKLQGYGVTVLSGPNGVGKSIFLDSMAAIAAGERGIPLRNGAARGNIDGLGVHVTLTPKSTRVAGEFDVANLEGKLNLATLVDPGIKDPVAADKRRIKALIALTGVEASRHLFEGRPEFPPDEFELIVQQDTLACDDLVEMAGKIARDYHSAAREWERMGKRDLASAEAIREELAGIDLEAESDADKLQEAYIAAQQAYSRASQQMKERDAFCQEALEAQQELARWDARDSSLDEATAKLSLAALKREGTLLETQRLSLLQQLAEVDKSIKVNAANIKTAEANVTIAAAEAGCRERCKKVIERYQAAPEITGELLAEKQAAFFAAREAMEQGVRVRDAKNKSTQIATLMASAEQRNLRAEKLRAAAAATDLVLCDSICTNAVKIVTSGEAGVTKRVLAFSETQNIWVPYHELSATEKWKLAIDIGVDTVGEDGLLFIPQEAWEGVDVWNRAFIDTHSKQKHVFILTAEATRDASDGTDFVCKPLSA